MSSGVWFCSLHFKKYAICLDPHHRYLGILSTFAEAPGQLSYALIRRFVDTFHLLQTNPPGSVCYNCIKLQTLNVPDGAGNGKSHVRSV